MVRLSNFRPYVRDINSLIVQPSICCNNMLQKGASQGRGKIRQTLLSNGMRANPFFVSVGGDPGSTDKVLKILTVCYQLILQRGLMEGRNVSITVY